MYLNKAFIIGNLTRDPELKSLPSGIKVVTFSVATNRVWKDKNGVKQESADFHNIVSFGKQAETIAQYMEKGSSIFIEGRMQTRSWDDKESGQKRYRTEIVADRFQFGPKSGDVSAQGGSASGGKASGGGTKSPEIDTIEYPEESGNLEEIPF